MSMRVAFFKEAVPGIVLGLFKRYSEIKNCLFASCDSHILKVEKVLIHTAFVLGYASPSRLIWEMLKKLLIGACSNLGTLIADHPTVESGLRMMLSLVEQIQLAHVWDYVRDGSICLRFNNCDGDFLGQLNNIKIKTCKVRFPFDDRKKVTVCERLFNDTPLILLAVGMILLAIIANTQLAPELLESVATTISSSKSDSSSTTGSSGTEPPALRPGSKDEDPSDPPATDSPTDPNAPPADPNAPPPAPPVPPTDPTAPPSDPMPPADPSDPPTDPPGLPPTDPNDPPTDPPDQPPTDPPSQPPTGPPDVPPTDPKVPPKDPKGPPPPKRKPKPPPEKKTQVIHTQCPNCTKSSYMTVPRPWELCCSKSIGIIGTRKDTSKTDTISEEVVKELLNEIKCAYCRDKLKKKLQEIASRKNKDKTKDAKKSPKK